MHSSAFPLSVLARLLTTVQIYTNRQTHTNERWRILQSQITNGKRLRNGGTMESGCEHLGALVLRYARVGERANNDEPDSAVPHRGKRIFGSRISWMRSNSKNNNKSDNVILASHARLIRAIREISNFFNLPSVRRREALQPNWMRGGEGSPERSRTGNLVRFPRCDAGCVLLHQRQDLGGILIHE